MTPDWAQQIETGTGRLGLRLSDEQADKLCRYLALLDKWNKAFNLTAVRDRDLWVERHLMDSLSILPWLHGARVLDVGSGAGLPGVPLAVARPELSFTLVDANGKKTRFLKQVKMELPLPNVEVVHERVEGVGDELEFDTIVSRAYASLSDFWTSASHLLVPGGLMLAMKGKLVNEEIAALVARHDIRHEVHELPTDQDEDRNLYVLRPAPIQC